MGFLSSAHPQDMFLITYCMKASGNSAWIQSLYAVLLIPLLKHLAVVEESTV